MENHKQTKPSLLKFIVSPVQQLNHLKEIPVIWGSMFILILLNSITAFIQMTGMPAPDIAGLEEEITADTDAVMVVTTIIGRILLLLANIVVMSAIHMLVAKLALSKVSFKQLFSMNTFIWVIPTLGAVLNAILIFVIKPNNPLSLITSLDFFINKSGSIETMSGLWNKI